MRKDSILKNSRSADSSSKTIFENKILCAQFLKDYVDFPFLKEIKPEDIEILSERFVPLFSEERNADSVLRVNIFAQEEERPFYFISLIEHKSSVDYDICMQIFRYMIYIWEDYVKDMERRERGISRKAGFQYPPIIPIVYYEGTENWTAPRSFRQRISHEELWGKYIPDFEYYLVPLKDFHQDDILKKEDELSLIMLINKMQTREDISRFMELPAEKLQAILKNTPEYLMDIISKIYMAFLLKVNVPPKEAEEMTFKIKEKRMGLLFENMEKIDVQKEWELQEKGRLEIAEMKRELKREMEAAKREMEAAKREMEVVKKEMEAVKKEREVMKKRLDEDKRQLDISKRQLEEDKRRFNEDKKWIDADKRQLDESKKQLEEDKNQLEEQKKQLEKWREELEKK